MTSASCCASLAAPEAVCRLTWGMGGGAGDRPLRRQASPCTEVCLPSLEDPGLPAVGPRRCERAGLLARRDIRRCLPKGDSVHPQSPGGIVG